MKHVPVERRGDFFLKMYELEEEVCVQLLTRSRFGRVGFDDDEGLAILPVNCLFSRGAVLFRTNAGSVFDRICDGRQVVFEADDIDTDSESGWSVLVRGRASHVTDAEWISSLADTDVRPWAPGPRDLWIELRPDRVTGRIIRRDRHSGTGQRLPSLPPD